MIDVSGGKSSIKNSVAIMSAGDVFVINLCASMTPMPSVPKSLKGYEEHRLYQVARIEDGRHRYRLRLGFFNSEGDAELAVASLRSLYPAAFASRAGAEDMRYVGDPLLTGRFTARAPSAPSAEAKPAVTTAVSDSVPKSAATSAQRSVAPMAPRPTTATKPQALSNPTIAKPAQQPSIELTAQSLLDVELPVNHRSTPFTVTSHQPFHVARGVDIPDSDLELAPTIIPVPPKAKDAEVQVHSAAVKSLPQATNGIKPKSNTAAASAPVTKPAAAAAKISPPPQVSKSLAALANAAAAKKSPASTSPTTAAAKPMAFAARPAQTTAIPAVPLASKPATKNTDDYVPILDTTMTIRTISMAELEDANQPKWFSVQLATSEQPFNLDAMPKLDIFAAYRLYSVVVNSDDSKLKHSLRLGFFKEEVSADAVSGYLKTFFPAPTITRIGVAEYERFIEPKFVAPAPAEVESKVVNLNDKREAATAPSKPTFGVTPAPSPVRPKTAIANNSAAKRETTQPGLRRGPTGKYSIEAMKKNQANSSDSGVRKNLQRPQSFLSKLIGRELD